jgi:hypothetical protein
MAKAKLRYLSHNLSSYEKLYIFFWLPSNLDYFEINYLRGKPDWLTLRGKPDRLTLRGKLDRLTLRDKPDRLTLRDKPDRLTLCDDTDWHLWELVSILCEGP